MNDKRTPIDGQPVDIRLPLQSMLNGLGITDYSAVRKVEITPRQVVVYVVQRGDDGNKQLAPDWGVLLSEHKLAVIT